MFEGVGDILVSRQEISSIVERLGLQITKDYKGKELLMLCVLKGAVVFMSDLVRRVNIPVTVDFLAVSSYGDSTTSTGVVKITKDMDVDIAGKNVLLVEDIVDTGLTLKYLKKLLLARKPASLKICTMFDKPSRRKTEINPDYCGMEIPDKFVIGYGLDYREMYRNLPDLCVIAEK